ncbi:hypothetical protein B0H13DRAFT_2549619 [Mycena leptocephala]|nr:hypothetical protein B0H13DRAFT_2549619 [Mycena leptocephala]
MGLVRSELLLNRDFTTHLVQQDSFQQLKCSALSPVAAAAFGNLGGVTLEAEGIVASLGMITIKPAAGPVITQVCGEEDESEDGAKISTVFMDQPNSIQVVVQRADCSKTAHQAVEWLLQGLCTTPHISWRKSGTWHHIDEPFVGDRGGVSLQELKVVIVDEWERELGSVERRPRQDEPESSSTIQKRRGDLCETNSPLRRDNFPPDPGGREGPISPLNLDEHVDAIDGPAMMRGFVRGYHGLLSQCEHRMSPMTGRPCRTLTHQSAVEWERWRGEGGGGAMGGGWRDGWEAAGGGGGVGGLGTS